MQSSRIDSILIITMFGVFLFSGFKLFHSNSLPLAEGNSPLLAEVYSLNNTVKKKSGNQMAWNDAKAQQKLFNGDQLYTHENSEVDILFEDKTRINILENSLFKLEERKSETVLVLKEGIFYIKTSGGSKKLKIQVANKELTIDSVESKIQVEREEYTSRVIVLEGQAKISLDTEELQLAPHEYLNIKDDQEELKVQPLPIRILSPEHGAQFYSHEKVQFLWDSTSKNPSLFEISADPKFKSILLSKSSNLSELTRQSIPKGTYYWRVLQKDSDIAFEVRKLQVFDSVDVIGPLFSSVIRMRRPDSSVYFRWKKKASKHYHLEISRDLSFKTLELSKHVRGDKYSWDKATLGQYFWRIKEKGSEETIFTKPFPFEIQRERPLPAPEIKGIKKKFKIKIKKKEIKSTSFLNFFINTATADELVKETTLEWPANKDAKSYWIEVYSDKNLTNKILEKETPSNSFTWENPPTGKIYWRISNVDYWDQPSPFSAIIESEIIYKKADAKKKIKISKKKKIELAPEKKAALISKIEKKKQYFAKIKRIQRNSFQFIEAPSAIKFKSSQGKIKAESSGSSLASVELEVILKNKSSQFYATKIKRLSGTAFTNTEYSNISAGFSWGKYFHIGQSFPLYIQAGLLGSKSNYYTREGIDTLIKNTNTSFAATGGLGGQKPGPFSTTQHFLLAAAAGTTFRIGATYDLKYQWNKNYNVTLGLGSELEKYSTKEEVSVSLFTANIRLGLAYFF